MIKKGAWNENWQWKIGYVCEYEKKPLPSNGTTIGPTKFATFSGQTCFY